LHIAAIAEGGCSSATLSFTLLLKSCYCGTMVSSEETKAEICEEEKVEIAVENEDDNAIETKDDEEAQEDKDQTQDQSSAKEPPKGATTTTASVKSSPQEKESSKKGIPLWVLFLLGFLGGAAVLGVSLGIVFGIRNRNDNNDNRDVNLLELEGTTTFPNPTISPTVNPSLSPVEVLPIGTAPTREAEVLNYFSTIAGDGVFQEGNPLNVAAKWILFEDPRNQEPTATTRLQENLPPKELLQRFLLVYFYYLTSQNGERPWRSCNPPPTTKPLETGCLFDFPIRNNEDETFEFASREGIRWLSSEEECNWAGIECVERPEDHDSEIKRFAVTTIQLGTNMGLTRSMCRVFCIVCFCFSQHLYPPCWPFMSTLPPPRGTETIWDVANRNTKFASFT
jgi:hypothetical protein